MKVLLFCAKGFEAMEFSPFIDVMGWAADSFHFPVRQKQLAEFGVNVINERIVIDDNIITSFCPETAPHVAFELLRKLVGDEKMLIIKKSMGF